MDIREFKVSEVNRILPMIRETIKKQKSENELRKKHKQQTELADKLNKELDMLRSTLSLGDLDETTKQKSQLLRKQKEETLNNINSSIEDCCIQITDLVAQIVSENSLYYTIGNVIKTKSHVYIGGEICGVFKINELQEEFIEEYAYLIDRNRKLNIFDFLCVSDKLNEELKKALEGQLFSETVDYLRHAITLAKELD